MPFPSLAPRRDDRGARRVLALADDLSGAAETAVALGVPGRIVLGPASLDPHAYGEAVVTDLDCRRLPAADAARRVRGALRAVPSDVLVLKKADSLLRGNLAAETAACVDGAEGVVVAAALPALGRTVRDGVVHLDGVPLHTTDAWRAESTSPPPSISAALGDARTMLVPLDAVRGDALPALLHAAITAGHLPMCDAETDADLDLIARAALACGPDVRLTGTSGLAAAVGRLLRCPDGTSAATTAGQAAPAPAGERRQRPLLVVVGTADPSMPAQIAQLTERGARHISVNPDVLNSDVLNSDVLNPDVTSSGVPAPPRVPRSVDAVSGDVTVLSIDSGPGIRLGSAHRLVYALARLAADRAGDADLVLTGGETARRVLDALGVRHLTPLGQIHHGAVHARTPDGRHVVTRPGSFGGTDSLLRIATALRPDFPHLPTSHRKETSR
ncbi:4-hydroxythreonine-4-phosphate dehydrogenase [Streptomyces sp. NBC_01725]|uniref:four-carbon acid sugar kinase family protein n=1 Tax=Streptomyces sp. NBC_01725 TaxID=2975923 RepID=UPI002E2B0DD2|nr:four-carbon acid sugar kinase family protein [Streptomyces sp. NBC_01725]